jgi:hypothetical protein
VAEVRRRSTKASPKLAVTRRDRRGERLAAAAGVRSCLLFVAGLLCTGCSPTYAPPVRAWHHGAPGRLAQGELELGAVIGGYAAPAVGGPRSAYAIRDWVAVESASNLSLGSWVLQSTGLRFTLTRALTPRVRLSADLEVGGGIGVGGRRCHEGECDGIEWSRRLAGGGYQGLGLGLHVRWFSFYVRGKVEETIARNIPLTVWPSTLLGIAFDIKHQASLDLGAGYLAYWNAVDHEHGLIYQIGVTLYLDARPRERLPRGGL